MNKYDELGLKTLYTHTKKSQYMMENLNFLHKKMQHSLGRGHGCIAVGKQGMITLLLL